MTAIRVHHTPDIVLTVDIVDAIALPDPEAAEALNGRFAAWARLDKLQERSFAERGLIIREFERRHLWRHLTDPDTGRVFPHLTAWLSCSDFLGCRRTNFAAKRTLGMLEDVPAAKLIDIPKGNLQTLAQLSTAVRNQPEVLEAARSLSRDKFEAKVEVDHPEQHIEGSKPMRFNFGRSHAKTIEKWIAHAIEHDIAGTREEAIERACEIALYDAELDEELKRMSVEMKR